MNAQEALADARDTLTVKRIFGEPYEKNGVTVIPVAKVQGGGGQGEGVDVDGRANGSGSGFGVNARPAGAYVVDGASVVWRPAIDVNRAIIGGQLVAVVALVVLRSIVKMITDARKLDAKG